MHKNSWFKHYNTASQGATLRSLWDSKDYEAYAFFWLFLEMLSRWEDPNERGKLTISWATIARETTWKPSKCRRVLARICSVSKIETNQLPNGNVSFLVPNWLELQENRGGKKSSKNHQSSTDVRSKKREKDLDTDVEERRGEIQKLLADAGLGERDAESRNQRGPES